MALSAEGRWEQSVMEHREILAALKAGDTENAGILFAKHVERTGAIVAQTATTKAPRGSVVQEQADDDLETRSQAT